MFPSQFPGPRIKRRLDRHARIAFAHDRLHEERLDKDAIFLRVGEDSLERFDIIGFNLQQVVAIAVGRQVLFVLFCTGVRITSRAVSTTVKTTF